MVKFWAISKMTAFGKQPFPPCLKSHHSLGRPIWLGAHNVASLHHLVQLLSALHPDNTSMAHAACVEHYSKHFTKPGLFNLHTTATMLSPLYWGGMKTKISDWPSKLTTGSCLGPWQPLLCLQASHGICDLNSTLGFGGHQVANNKTEWL